MLKQLFAKKSDNYTAHIVLLFASLFALLAAFQLSVDKLHILENPEAGLSCSINAVLNCASVMKTPQASLLGFPNSFLGLMAYPVFVFVAISLLGGGRFAKNIWRLLFAGAFSAALFAWWLYYDSVYVIQILCPWCLLTTTMTTIIFAVTTRLALLEGVLGLSKANHKKATALLKNQYDVVLVASFLALLSLLIVMKFGDSLFA
jgi:uncharacterized membrane protein